MGGRNDPVVRHKITAAFAAIDFECVVPFSEQQEQRARPSISTKPLGDHAC